MNNKAGFVLKQTYIVFVNVVLLNLPVFPSFGKPYLSHLVSKHQHYNSQKKLTFWHEDFIKLWVMWRCLLLSFLSILCLYTWDTCSALHPVQQYTPYVTTALQHVHDKASNKILMSISLLSGVPKSDFQCFFVFFISNIHW